MSKSSVWHWIHKEGLPTLQNWLAIAFITQRAMTNLLKDDPKDWIAPGTLRQLTLPLDPSPRKGIESRNLDWTVIRSRLHTFLTQDPPISLAQICKLIEVDQKSVYRNANSEAQALVSRYHAHQEHASQNAIAELHKHVTGVAQERYAEGAEGVSARNTWPQLSPQLRAVRHSFRHIGQAVAATRP